MFASVCLHVVLTLFCLVSEDQVKHIAFFDAWVSEQVVWPESYLLVPHTSQVKSVL